MGFLGEIFGGLKDSFFDEMGLNIRAHFGEEKEERT